MKVLMRSLWENVWVPMYREVFKEKGHSILVKPYKDTTPPQDPDVVLHMWANGVGPLDVYGDAVQIMFLRGFEFLDGEWVHYDWSKVDALVFCNIWTKEQAEYHAASVGVKLPETYLIYNGVDTRQWTFKDRGEQPIPTRIGMVCHVHPKKNLPLAMEILKVLPSVYELHIAGEVQDVYTSTYLDYWSDLSGRKVILHEEVPHSQMDDWWEGMGFCLSTSIREGNPNNVIEAMAKGIMPVVYNWPGATHQFGYKWVFNTVEGARRRIMFDDYTSHEYLQRINEQFSMDNYRQVVDLAEYLVEKKNEKCTE